MTPRFDSLPDAYSWLDSHINYEKRLGNVHYGAETFALDSFRALMRRLGDPQRGRRSIHIAGSCGKGSSALFLESILRGLGFKTATYMSPHPTEYRERVRINGEPLAGEAFCRHLAAAAIAPPEPDDASQHAFKTVFEFLTAVYFLAARDTEVDWMIVETGLGGRLDATNILDPGPVLWTKISLEHTRLLGPTVAAIAAEKAAILKPGGWGVAARQEPGGEAERVFRARAAETGGECVSAPDAAPILRAKPSPDGIDAALEFRGEPLPLRLPLLGPFLVDNLQGALAVIAGLVDRCALPPFSPDRLCEILESIRLPGRMELSPFPPLIIDAGHCPAAARAVAEAMLAHFPNGRAIAVVGMVDDKDHDSFFRGLSAWPGWLTCICHTVENPRAVPAEALAGRARPYFPRVDFQENLLMALELAAASAEDTDRIVVTGSAFSVAAAAQWGRNHASQRPARSAPAQALARPGQGDP